MRRLIIEEPVSRPAKWSPKLAWFALAVTILAVLLIRFGRIDYQSGFTVLGAGVVIALVAVVLSLMGFIRIWQEGRRGLGSAIRGLILATIVLAYPGFMALKAATLPPISDVSTDTEDPPLFSRSRAALQARDGRVPPDVPPEVREMQRASYVQIAPLTLDIGPDEAFAIVRKAAENLGWQVVEAVPPGGRVGLGRLEAVDRSRILKMPYDITVRVRPRVDGTRIDIRSASRFGSHDLGANAAHIRDFLEEASNLALAVR
ncbi:DUF1499 domain-containing protein [Microvirga arsenatis]|uniref:DUF1499 domain-containing protein n=1 Tax=Microvirga arsenatis TaxID=2692265 RepID=A0ABW9Z010_9HYPH|nr:DUF1499 domain-containing protein [Microvirga arsenatis]NBJ11405.1 DUF1499 domain-containing protein [Microvirga arsenatis]NBJ25678.1 DUF1499 domain-containing protein [Microvirga arsenatis]